jgi:hypothetical protein
VRGVQARKPIGREMRAGALSSADRATHMESQAGVHTLTLHALLEKAPDDIVAVVAPRRLRKLGLDKNMCLFERRVKRGWRERRVRTQGEDAGEEDGTQGRTGPRARLAPTHGHHLPWGAPPLP